MSVPVVALDPRVVGVLLAAHRRSDGAEPCALLLGYADARSIVVEDAVPTPNAHPSPDRAFAIGAEALLEVARRARAEGRRVVGCWHGHGEGRADLSEADRAGVANAALVPGVDGVPEEVPFAYLVSGRGAGRAIVLRAFLARRDRVLETTVRATAARDRRPRASA